MMAVPTMRPATTVAVCLGLRPAFRAAIRDRMGRRIISAAMAKAARRATMARTMAQVRMGGALDPLLGSQLQRFAAPRRFLQDPAVLHVDDAVAASGDG